MKNIKPAVILASLCVAGLLLISANDFVQLFSCDWKACLGATSQESGNLDPTAWGQRQAERFGLVPQVFGQKLADGDAFFIIHVQTPSKMVGHFQMVLF